jgi:deoxyribonuclease IV
MPKIGIKLWSTNVEVLPQIGDMYSRSIFDYIELYFVPGTESKVEKLWSGLKVPMSVHAPHFGHGFNLADKDLMASNSKMFKGAVLFADLLNAETIIVHGGNGGAKDEAIRQLKSLRDPRLLIENKPKMGLNGKECIGYLPEDIAEIAGECGLGGFVLDFNHAVCAARALSEDPLAFIERFLSLRPRMFHLGDGDYFASVDTHMNLGEGSMPLDKISAFLSRESKVTLETPHDFAKGFNDFESNRVYFNRLLTDRQN